MMSTHRTWHSGSVCLVVLFISCISLISCITGPRFVHVLDDPSLQTNVQQPDEYKAGLQFLQNGEYAKALANFNSYLKSHALTPYTLLATLNAGRALEGLEQWEQAIAKYQIVVADSSHTAPRLQAMSVYRIAHCEEMLGNLPLEIASLLDARNRRQWLPQEISSAELPSRLAAAYARNGNLPQAQAFFSEAETGLAVLKRQVHVGSPLPDWYPQTLLAMGRMPMDTINWNDFAARMQPFEKLQLYLLECVELGIRPWSTAAARELHRDYQTLWDVLSNPPVQPVGEDTISMRRDDQQRAWSYARLTVQSLAELQAHFLPSEATGSPLEQDEIRKLVSEMNQKLAVFLQETPIGNELTPDASRRHQKGPGRTISEDAELEENYARHHKKKRKSRRRFEALPEKQHVLPAPKPTSGEPSETPALHPTQ